MNHSSKLGLALFALGIIIFLGQRVVPYANIIASFLLAPDSRYNEVMLQSYNAIYVLSIALIVAGVVMFFRGRKEATDVKSSAAPNQDR